MAKHKGIYKRGRIYWICYAGPDGRVRRESSGSTSLKEAQALLIQRKKEVMEGKDPALVKRIGNHTFSELAEHYLKWCERQRSYRSKRGFVLHLLHAFGNLPLRGFTVRLVEEWQTEKLKTCKPATVNRHLATLKHMLRKAVEWEMVEEEVLKRVRKVKLIPEHNRRLRYLTREECQKLIDACDPHLRPIVITALNTGMRKGEILSLRWDQVDLKHGFILLERTKNGERREIPINQTLKEVFHSIPRRIERGRENPYVFINPETGKPYGDVKKSFQSALRRAGIKDFRFHDLRHTFASHLVMAGIDLTTVKELLGHKSLTMTLRYAHLAPSHKRNAVNELERILTGKSTSQLLHNQG